MIRKTSYALLALILAGAVFVSCKKQDIVTPPPLAHFIGAKNQSLTMTSAATPPFKLEIGTTDVSNSNRVVTYNITSPTGAVLGTHYTLSTTGNTVTIPAGQATAAIEVKGIFSQYESGRKDTLVFTLAKPEVDQAKFADTVRLALRGPCFEGDVTLSAFLGAYTKTTENFGGSPYGPYTTSISAVNQLSATTGTITVENIFDYGWEPITFTLDWTDPANRTVTVVSQSSGIADAGTISSSFAGEEVAVRPFAGDPGTFSACNGTIVLKMDLGVAGLGWFGELYQVNLLR